MIDQSFIQLDHVSKRFGGIVALHDVSFGIGCGEVHAIVGENGAGKSTLMKLLAGVHQPDEGEIKISGKAVRLKSPRHALRQGVSIVFQELNLFPHRTVAANMFVNRELTTNWGTVDQRAMRHASAEVLNDMEVNISPDALVASLSIAEKQLIEIARTLHQKSRIIILDEPNSALNESESKRLFDILRGLRSRGITIIYVSHRLEEVFAIADRISVIRDGKYHGTFVTARTSIAQIITAMIGRRLEELFPERRPISQELPIVLKVDNLSRANAFGPVTFIARVGEIVGFAGLEGEGVDELFQTLFGLEAASSGQVTVRGQVQSPATPGAAMAGGWAMIPSSRRDQGLLMEWPIARNLSLLVLDKLQGWQGLIERRKVSSITKQYMQQLQVAAENEAQKVKRLSGGNQQKVLLAKWLATSPSILLLNNPTRGVDVGSKSEIYDLCQKLTAQGMTILVTSAELEEILGLADRVLVFSGGKIVREVPRGQSCKADLLHAMAGQNPAPHDHPSQE
ncbi:MAG TPA: sugar ABC transporter ATP-binding protein [Candidatus Saccharimonadales bacterium]|nr:sugar ABC transporter ATP-binding protein [Candidatus Saccharimonadales bacterium]